MKVWLGLKLRKFENAILPDSVMGVLPVFRTVADANKNGYKRNEITGLEIPDGGEWKKVEA